ncbi:uncharacterized protein LOC112688369 [Sipha flava]|uniref:Uncharacterized protein LOC112688369 n=1 Tax=Sipha flava TaxID=143950 RepID=A0A8B8G265_9HEMI|nr:uncharacterized protein LOC112688369 [Sipha flava]
MRHQFISDLVSDLNELYNFQLGLSLSVLFIMSLLDIYDTVSKENTTTKTYLLFYGWMAQYLLRFSFIVLTTQATSKQANKSKTLLTDIDNRYLNNNTKEELRLFLSQVSSHPVEFTTFDFFTLDAHLITSAIIAGTTYLVILLQFR